MRHSVSAGCLDGWKFIRTLTITTGNTGRRIITPIKQKSRHRFMKSIMNTMVSMVTGAWQSIWHVRDITTALQPYISTWMRSWDWDPSFVPKKQIMNRENHTRCLKTNFSRILCRIQHNGSAHHQWSCHPHSTESIGFSASYQRRIDPAFRSGLTVYI